MDGYKDANFISTHGLWMVTKLLKTFSFISVSLQVQTLRTCLRHWHICVWKQRRLD